jgi:hypothetical protein
VAGGVDLLQLSGPDLGDAAAGGKNGVVAKIVVELREGAVGVDGFGVVIRLAGQLAAQGGQAVFDIPGGGKPSFFADSVSARMAFFASATIPRSAGKSCDLRGLHIDMDEFALAPVNVQRTGVAVGEAAADA